MKKLTLDTVVEYVLICTICMVISLIGNCINTITDANPDVYVSILEGLPGMLILLGIAIAGITLSKLVPQSSFRRMDHCDRHPAGYALQPHRCLCGRAGE